MPHETVRLKTGWVEPYDVTAVAIPVKLAAANMLRPVGLILNGASRFGVRRYDFPEFPNWCEFPIRGTKHGFREGVYKGFSS